MSSGIQFSSSGNEHRRLNPVLCDNLEGGKDGSGEGASGRKGQGYTCG